MNRGYKNQMQLYTILKNYINFPVLRFCKFLADLPSVFILITLQCEQGLQEPEAFVNPDYGVVTPVLVHPYKTDDMDPQQYELAILKEFPFESKEQHMTVVIKSRHTSAMEVFVKGAPEKVITLCRGDTGLPYHFFKLCPYCCIVSD